MKKICFILLIILSSSFVLLAERNPIIIHNTGTAHDHSEYYLPADAPDVFYDSNEMEIVIEADGFSSYYYVYIIRNTPYQTVISTQISGYGDTIDVSSLSAGNYTIVITSEFNNVFEGQFTII